MKKLIALLILGLALPAYAVTTYNGGDDSNVPSSVGAPTTISQGAAMGALPNGGRMLAADVATVFGSASGGFKAKQLANTYCSAGNDVYSVTLDATAANATVVLTSASTYTGSVGNTRNYPRSGTSNTYCAGLQTNCVVMSMEGPIPTNGFASAYNMNCNPDNMGSWWTN